MENLLQIFMWLFSSYSSGTNSDTIFEKTYDLNPLIYIVQFIQDIQSSKQNLSLFKGIRLFIYSLPMHPAGRMSKPLLFMFQTKTLNKPSCMMHATGT